MNKVIAMGSTARSWGMGMVVLLTLSVSGATDANDSSDTLYQGYAIIREPALRTDLQQVVYLHVQGRTVLEGLIQILQGTGYRLAGEGATDPEIGRLYEQPYPDHQREIGPRALGTVLERLAGRGWRVVEDPVDRLISFEVQPAYRARAGTATVLSSTLPEGDISDWSRGGQR